jgi:Ser/Thr protein kinase RdoA (MazF antagonist)
MPCNEKNDTLAALRGFCEAHLGKLQRLESRAWASRAQGILSAAAIKEILSRVDEAAPRLKGLKRVPCHRDYTPRNWLFDGSGVCVIDFEHSRPDWWLVDIEKLWSLHGYEAPYLMKAFLEGYGRPLTDDDWQLLKVQALLSAMTTIVWAKDHHDEAFEAIGWRILSRSNLS